MNSFLNDFECDYRKENAIIWYTREVFSYHMLNKEFLVQDIAVLFLFRTVIQNIFDVLHANKYEEH